MEPYHTVPGSGNEPQGNSNFLGSSQDGDSMQAYESFGLPRSGGTLPLPPLRHTVQTYERFPPPYFELQPGYVNNARHHASVEPSTTVIQNQQPIHTAPPRQVHLASVEQSISNHDIDVTQYDGNYSSYPSTVEERDIPWTQDHQEEQQPVANLSRETLSQQRKIRCLKCRFDRGHRECFNYPVCDRCIIEFPGGIEKKNLLDQRFLEWQELYNIFEELGYNNDYSWVALEYNVNAVTGMAGERVSDSCICEAMENIVLNFSFDDRTEISHHTVIFRPREQTEMRRFPGRQAEDLVRAPVIDLPQLDAFVQKGVWGETLWASDEDQRLQVDERDLWSKVRLFLGYVSLNHNLATTSIQSPDYMPAQMQRRISAELVYAIGWHLQFLWFQISQRCLQLVGGEVTVERPVVIFYALEILYRLMRLMRWSDWGIPESSPLRALITLENNFNTRVERVLRQICVLECVASGGSHPGRKINRAPKLLSFARSLRESPFPGHCLLTAYRHRDMPFLTPLWWDTSTKRRLIDVLGCGVEDSGNDTTTDRHKLFLDNYNQSRKVTRPLTSSITVGAVVAETRTEASKARKENSGRPVIPVVYEMASRLLDEDTATVKAQDGSARGTPVPSLTDESSPVPTPSPATPFTPTHTI